MTGGKMYRQTLCERCRCGFGWPSAKEPHEPERVADRRAGAVTDCRHRRAMLLSARNVSGRFCGRIFYFSRLILFIAQLCVILNPKPNAMSQENNTTPSARNREAYAALTEMGGNVPPQAVELEEAVLGALMLEKDSIITVQEFVTPEAFYTEEHRLIYRAIEELSSELKPIDLYTVTERLKVKKELKKVGGASYLAQLTQKVGSAANVEFHAKIVAQKYVQRELIRSATEIQRRSYDESTDVTDLIGFAEQEIFKVAEGHVKRSVQSAADVLARTLAQIEENAKNKSAFNGVPSGFMALDRVTMGWQPSDLIIIAARPSMGKTAFTLTMARNMSVDHEQAVAFFSLEMPAHQLMMRLVVAETGIPGNDLKLGRLSPEQWRHLESATKPLGSAKLFIDDTPALSV